MSKGPWLSADQRAALIASYVEHGLEATKPLAISYGIKVRTISVVARREGKRGKSTPRKRKAEMIRTVDRKWQWAIDRGEVRL